MDSYVQMNFFNEAEQEAYPDVAEPEMEEAYPSSYECKKRKGKMIFLPSQLPI